MSKKDSLIPPNHFINNPSTKRNSNNNNNINKPIINLNKRRNTKNHIKRKNINKHNKRRNINNHIKKSNIIKKSNTKNNKTNLNTNKKNPEEKDKIDLNSIGTKNKSLLKLHYPKLLKKSFPNLMDKNSKPNLPNSENLRTVFSNKEKNLSMNKASLLKVITIAKRLDSVPSQNTASN